MDLFGRVIRFNVIEMTAERKAAMWASIPYNRRLRTNSDCAQGQLNAIVVGAPVLDRLLDSILRKVFGNRAFA